MNKLNAVQAEKLIDLIKERPVLFDKSNKGYKNVALKEIIWKEISENLGADEIDCKTAWRSLRDQFVKATKDMNGKPGRKATHKKKYKFYKQLLFLEDSLRTRTRAFKTDHLTDESETMDSDIEPILTVTKEESAFIDPDPNEFLIPSTPAIIPTNAPRSSSKKFKSSSKGDDCLQEFLTSVLGEIKCLNAPQRGENEQFFLSLANMITNANLSPSQTRQIQRSLFNFVADELDQIENDIKQI